MYPGDPCIENDYTTTCAYGLQKCQNGTCLGFGINGSCARTVDCETSQYCDAGKCWDFKKIG